MAEPRKIFRIEQMARERLGFVTDTSAQSRHAEVMNELAALRSLITASSTQSLKTENTKAAVSESDGRITPAREKANGSDPAITRIEHEIAEVGASMEQATQKIITAAEEIDQAARNLAATLDGKYETDLVQDIQDHIIRIFVACNFQDLSGQRVSKALATLKTLDGRTDRTPESVIPGSSASPGDNEKPLHGPRLDGDPGHLTQAEIDALFSSAD